LRHALRAELAGQPPLLGRELRVYPSNHSRNGTFLDELVTDGLLAVAVKATPATIRAGDGSRPEPEQFRTRYKLTDKGRHAAEYGEYDKPHTPALSPLAGIAAKIFGSQVEKRENAKRKGK
jgi:hypothetical protein